MPDRKPRTNRLLMVIAVIMCVFFSGAFTSSSANPSSSGQESSHDIFISDSQQEPDVVSDGSANTDELTDNIGDVTPTSVPVVTATPVPTKAPAKEKKVQASPEASKGIWVSSGTKWMFLVDGTPYTGWLTDTDGKQYFFNSEGIMQTGWLDDNGKRYYLNLDGIMQTGTITVDGESYTLNSDGSLKGYKPEKTDSKDKKSTADADTQTSDTEKTDSGNKKTTDSDTSGQTVAATKKVALTFDDGPSSFTGRLLDCLEKYNAKATFFMVGTEIASFPEEAKRIAELGCELGNHSYDHTNLTTVSSDEIVSQLNRVDSLLTELTGQASTVVRPPYGSLNDTVRASVNAPMILWSIDTLDWETLDAQKTVDTVMENVQDGSIILMHDIFSTSVDAAEILIPRLIESGYELVTVHELAAAKGVQLQPGIAYGSMSN